MANSRRRVWPRASSRLATFAHAISSTTPAVPHRISTSGRISCTACSANGISIAPKPRFVLANSLAMRCAIPPICARAASTDL